LSNFMAENAAILATSILVVRSSRRCVGCEPLSYFHAIRTINDHDQAQTGERHFGRISMSTGKISQEGCDSTHRHQTFLPATMRSPPPYHARSAPGFPSAIPKSRSLVRCQRSGPLFHIATQGLRQLLPGACLDLESLLTERCDKGCRAFRGSNTNKISAVQRPL